MTQSLLHNVTVYPASEPVPIPGSPTLVESVICVSEEDDSPLHGQIISKHPDLVSAFEVRQTAEGKLHLVIRGSRALGLIKTLLNQGVLVMTERELS